MHLGCVSFRIFRTLWVFWALERRKEAAFVCWHRMHLHKRSFVSVRVYLFFFEVLHCCFSVFGVSLVTCRHLAPPWSIVYHRQFKGLKFILSVRVQLWNNKAQAQACQSRWLPHHFILPEFLFLLSMPLLLSPHLACIPRKQSIHGYVYIT